MVWIIEKNGPQKLAPLIADILNSNMAAKITIFLLISPVLLHLGPQFKCLYLCFRCLETVWQCQNLRQRAAAILDFKMAAIWLRPTKSGPVGLKKLTFHTFHHVQYNGCFKHMNYRLSVSNKPCHTIFFKCSHGRPSKLGPSGDKIIPFSTLSTIYKSLSLLLSCTN